MTAQHDLERTLDAWFGGDATTTPPPEPLAHVIEATRHRRPRPGFVARLGSHWVGPANSGVRGGIVGLRPAIVVALIALLVVALAGGALLVASRLFAPRPVLHTYLNELVRAQDLPAPGAALVTLADGRVLFISSASNSGRAAGAWLYDPATGDSVSAGPMASPVGSVGPAVRLRDGRVLLIGDTVNQIFDPVTMQFAALGSTVTLRSAGSAALLHDGRVLIAGGMPPGGEAGVDPALRSAELFDPGTLSSTPTGPIWTPTGGGPMVTLPDGSVFMATDPAAEIYDPAAGTFGLAGATSSGGGGHPVALPDGRVVVVGSTGMYSGGRITVWDPATLTFSARDLLEPMTGASLLDDGRVLLIGMCRGRTTGWTGLYDPATRVTVPGPPTDACRPSSIRLADGRVLISGGTINGDALEAVPTVEIFQ